ncbi:MAG: mechanosensitive ion channel [Gemmatimonadetes bacterium]|nr:mechanosensitive ion channel family protein [Gemmatimonadota bacterium]NIQ52571.1 mechanosensitive ion channel family protein [Gemmatimonadota bacterium]NIU72709.1 mechanosensitive ion channel [Gammaproteobacteria bacterium]NIX43115.1 mechanosensitive ion channel [Gemmatimonadota bacterium]NIY07277.1 mechanosensitive ion channel [Gemmatimonadota bacterium]
MLEEVARAIEGVLPEPEPQVYLKQLGGSSIDWAVRVWTLTPDFWAVREHLTQRIKDALDDAEIGIPFPQMDVHLDGVPATAPPRVEAGGG